MRKDILTGRGRGQGQGYDKSGTTGKGGKGDKGKSGKDKPKPKPATKDDTVIVDRDKLDPAYDPYRCNTRSITAASRAAEDAGQVPNTQATSGSYFYDTIICVFLLCVCLFLFLLLLYYK